MKESRKIKELATHAGCLLPLFDISLDNSRVEFHIELEIIRERFEQQEKN
jgi:hypothetical protein